MKEILKLTVYGRYLGDFNVLDTPSLIRILTVISNRTKGPDTEATVNSLIDGIISAGFTV